MHTCNTQYLCNSTANLLIVRVREIMWQRHIEKARDNNWIMILPIFEVANQLCIYYIHRAKRKRNNHSYCKHLILNISLVSIRKITTNIQQAQNSSISSISKYRISIPWYLICYFSNRRQVIYLVCLNSCCYETQIDTTHDTHTHRNINNEQQQKIVLNLYR